MSVVEGAGLFAGLLFAPLVPDLQPGKYLVRDFTRGMQSLPALADTGFPFDVRSLFKHRPRSVPESQLPLADIPLALALSDWPLQ
jgi:hypothetical protein